MQIKGIIAGIVAATLIGGAAWAQTVTPEVKPTPEAPEADDKAAPETEADTPDGAAEADDDAVPPPPTDAAARAAHLTELFRRLSTAEDKDWQRIQAQIIGTWNRSGSASMDLLAARADKAVENKDYDGALLHLNDLVRLAPQFAEGWNKRATVHFLREDYGKSLEDISRALKLEPRHFGALAGLGIILDRIGDPKAALEAYRRALKIHPHLPGIKDGMKKLEKQVEGERL